MVRRTSLRREQLSTLSVKCVCELLFDSISFFFLFVKTPNENDPSTETEVQRSDVPAENDRSPPDPGRFNREIHTKHVRQHRRCSSRHRSSIVEIHPSILRNPSCPILNRTDKTSRTSTTLEDTIRRSISTKLKSGSDWSEIPESLGKYSDEPVMLHRSSQCKVKRSTLFRSLSSTLSLVFESDEWLPTYCESRQLATS